MITYDIHSDTYHRGFEKTLNWLEKSGFNCELLMPRPTGSDIIMVNVDFIQEKTLGLWGFQVGIKTFNMYYVSETEGRGVVIGSFRNLLACVFKKGYSDEVILSAIQRYKLTGNMDKFLDTMKYDNRKVGSSVSRYIFSSDIASSDVLNSSYCEMMLFRFIEAFLKLKETLIMVASDFYSRITDKQNSNNKFLEFRTFINSMPRFKILDIGVSDIINTEISDEHRDLVYQYSSKYAGSFMGKAGRDSMGTNTPKSRLLQLFEILENVNKEIELIFSDNPEAMLKRYGLDKLLTNDELYNVSFSWSSDLSSIGTYSIVALQGFMKESLDSYSSLYKRTIDELFFKNLNMSLKCFDNCMDLLL